MGLLRRHRLSVLKGWSIPRSMEWLFWPMGYRPIEFATPAIDDALALISEQGNTIVIRNLSVRDSPTSLKRRFNVANSEAFGEVVGPILEAERKVAEALQKRTRR